MKVPASVTSAMLVSGILCAQGVIDRFKPGQTQNLLPTDAAVLDTAQIRTSLPCKVAPVRPELGFDLGFHPGYQVRIRFRDLAAEGDHLTTIFRVTSANDVRAAVYFQQEWTVPPIPNDTHGSAVLDGAFTLGDGEYRVDWLIRDKRDRVCSSHWRISARLPAGKGQLRAALPRGSILPDTADPTAQEDASGRNTESPLRVAILAHISPETVGSATISPQERYALLSILRSIGREPRITSFSVTAFDLDHSQVLFAQQDVQQINFADLDTAISSLEFGTVSINRLAAKDAEARFLVDLAGEQVAQNRLDALIFVGPKVADDAAVSKDLLKRLGNARCPVFYLSYSTVSIYPWPNLIGSAVRYWRGYEFNISKPFDLLSAWSRIMSTIGPGNPWRNQCRTPQFRCE